MTRKVLQRAPRLSRRALVAVLLPAIFTEPWPQAGATAKQVDSSWKVGPITVEQAWVRLAKDKNRSASVYMIIHNRSAVDDHLLAVETDKAVRSEIHETVFANGSSTSQPVPGGLDMPSHGEVVMRPGSLHIMLSGLSKSIMPGDLLPVRMFFREAGMLELSIPILTETAADPIEKHTAHNP